MTIISEGQFNTVAYETNDRYSWGGVSRNIFLINEVDINKPRLKQSDNVAVKNNTRTMSGQKLMDYPIKQENIMIYSPENIILVPLEFDPQPKIHSFNSI